MVSEIPSFERPDFTVPTVAHWYVRHSGWVRGPYSLADMRRFRALNWLSRSQSVSRDMVTWTAAGGFSELWEDSSAAPAEPGPQRPPSPHATHWHYAAGGSPCDEPVSLAMLQILASIGRIQANDLVWREGWPDWRRAADVGGLIQGPSEWCSACGEPTPPRAARCPSCRARLPCFVPPHGELVLACGILGVALFPVFPLWVIAILIGRYDSMEIAKGRMDPAGLASARLGERLGIIGGIVFVLTTAIAAMAYLGGFFG